MLYQNQKMGILKRLPILIIAIVTLDSCNVYYKSLSIYDREIKQRPEREISRVDLEHLKEKDKCEVRYRRHKNGLGGKTVKGNVVEVNDNYILISFRKTFIVFKYTESSIQEIPYDKLIRIDYAWNEKKSRNGRIAVISTIAILTAAGTYGFVELVNWIGGT